MTTSTWTRNPFAVLGFLLGNFASLWGFVVAPIYLTAYGLLRPYAHGDAVALGGPMVLPLAPPLIGLVLAVLGCALTRPGQPEGRTASRIGLVLNAVAMAAALLL